MQQPCTLTQRANLLIQSEKYEDAAMLLRKSAQAGNIAAYHILAQLYLERKCYCYQSTTSALKILTYCANTGYIASQQQLGNMYSKGDYVNIDKQQALRWYTKAAKQNDLDSAIKAYDISPCSANLEKMYTLLLAQSSFSNRKIALSEVH